MKIKLPELEIDKTNPFSNCALDRKNYAEALTSLLAAYPDGFVLAINNEWGTGKTTFIKMWKQHLENADFKTRYFNAWENDFESDPLIPIMAELKTLTQKNDKLFDSLIKNGTKITQNIVPVLVKAIAEKYIETKVITEAIEKITESTSEILKDEIEEYTKKKEGLHAFKNDLSNFLKEHNAGNGKPIVFFIDELDRCKPNYAVELLEKIKHFFNVPGIIFVLSIDKVQLINSIKGFYGSEQINGEDYLRRFFDLEFNIPAPDKDLFSNFLYESLNFKYFFNSTERQQYRIFQNEAEHFLDFAKLLFSLTNTTLRQQQRVFSHARVVTASLLSNNYLFPNLLIFLIYIKEFHYKVYKQLRERQLSPKDMIKAIESCFPTGLQDQVLRSFINLEALLLQLYFNNYVQINHNAKITEIDNESKEKLSVKSGIDPTDNILFNNAFENVRMWESRTVKLSYLLDRIDLLSNIIG